MPSIATSIWLLNLNKAAAIYNILVVNVSDSTEQLSEKKSADWFSNFMCTLLCYASVLAWLLLSTMRIAERKMFLKGKQFMSATTMLYVVNGYSIESLIACVLVHRCYPSPVWNVQRKLEIEAMNVWPLSTERDTMLPCFSLLKSIEQSHRKNLRW